MDEWAKCGDHRDEVLLKQVRRFSGNQGNKKAITEQLTKEVTEWEKNARDEFLMSTTTLHHFFPVRSYEEINAQMDQIQKTVLSLLRTPCQSIANSQATEKYVEMMEQYIEFRKKEECNISTLLNKLGIHSMNFKKDWSISLQLNSKN